MRAVHSWTDSSATIGVEGLTRELRVLHITDPHIAQVDARDPQLADFQNLEDRFLHRHQNFDERGEPIAPSAAFAQTLAAFEGQGLDLVALTGDIVDVPAQASVDLVMDCLAANGTEFLYTAGNHDWLPPEDYEDKDSEAVRTKWWPALQRLHGGEPACTLRDIGGVRFLAVDDSIYQVTEEQLEFTRSSLAAGLPTVVLTHIPLSIATLRYPTIEVMGQAILLGDPGWELASRQESHVGVDTAETLEFVRLVAGAENLVAVLCGHIHFAHADAVGPCAVQYVGGPNFAGEYRLVELRPLA